MASEPQNALTDLLARKSLADLDEEPALDKLAHFVDAAGDAGERLALEHALLLTESIRSKVSPAGGAHLLFFEANAWAGLRQLNHRTGGDVWDWNQKEDENEVVCLRRAINGSAVLPRGRQIQILTNLGNAMSRLGRPVEAIAYYDRALKIYPKFSMALGNRATAFKTYATYNHDIGHKRVFLARARDDFTEALKYDAEPGAHEGFTRELAEMRRRSIRAKLSDFDVENHSLGKSAEERRFRKWVLGERLFLNPLNDLGPFPIAGRDVMQLPTIVTSLEVGASFHSFFNQLKQEFAGARWLCFEALAPGGAANAAAEIADREVMLLDARDGARFGLGLEKLKLSFRAAYSLLDKIAVFLNAFLELGAAPQRVSLRSVWYENADPKKGLNPKLPKENLPLRGLYWLSRDYVESDAKMQEAMEPDAREVAMARNRLEHRFLRVTDYHRQAWKNDLGYNLSPEALRARTLRLLRSTRAALIYLVLGLHAYEALNRPKSGKVSMPDILHPWENDDSALL